MPCNARTGKPASVTNPADWCDLETALAACAKGTHEGVGFVFAPGDGFVGIDLDKCRDKDTGELTACARRTLAELGTYAEVSPSGTGVKAFALGTVAGGKRRGNVEVYGEGRFFTVTGDHVPGTPADVQPAGAALERLQAALASGSASAPVEGGTGFTGADAALVARALKAKNGPKLAAYMAGEQCGKPSRSEALRGMACILAFWTGADPERLDRIIRGTNLWHQSESERPKWYSRRGDSTWGRKYIVEGAIAATASYYSGSAPPDPEDKANTPHLYKHGRRFDLVERLLERVRSEPIPAAIALAVTSRKHAGLVRQQHLATLCLRLAQHNEGEFYLSTVDAGKMLGVDQSTVSKWLRKFATLGLIKRTKLGNGIGGVANCYRWIGPRDEQAAAVPPTPEPAATLPQVAPNAGNPSVPTNHPESVPGGSRSIMPHEDQAQDGRRCGAAGVLLLPCGGRGGGVPRAGRGLAGLSRAQRPVLRAGCAGRRRLPVRARGRGTACARVDAGRAGRRASGVPPGAMGVAAALPVGVRSLCGLQAAQHVAVVFRFPLGAATAAPVRVTNLSHPQALARPSPAPEHGVGRMNR